MLNLRRSPISFSCGLPFTTLLQAPGMNIMNINSKAGKREFIDAQGAGAGYRELKRSIVAGLVLSIPRPLGRRGQKITLSTGFLCGEYSVLRALKGEIKKLNRGLGYWVREALGPIPHGWFPLLGHGLADGPPVSPERGPCNRT